MAGIALATVSTASLPDDVVERYNITVMPTTINLMDGNYIEGRGFSLEAFYRRLSEAEVTPTTSPATPSQIMRCYQTLLEQADAVLMVHVSRYSSRTYEYACRAAAQLPTARIINIDSGSITLGTGLQALQAARALAASLLNIYPVLGMGRQGIKVFERPRTHEAALERMLELCADFAGASGAGEIGIVHTNALAEARALQARLQRHFPGAPTMLSDAGPAIAAHVGPGGVGIGLVRV